MNILKKLIAVVLAVTVPLWIIPAIFILVAAAGIHEAYKQISVLIGVK